MKCSRVGTPVNDSKDVVCSSAPISYTPETDSAPPEQLKKAANGTLFTRLNFLLTFFYHIKMKKNKQTKTTQHISQKK